MAIDNQSKYSGNVKDLSNDNGFQFEFLCSTCGLTHKSEFKRLKTDALSNAVKAVGGMMSSFFGVATDIKKTRSPKWQHTHGIAFQEAVAEIKTLFSLCPQCHLWVCNKNCWDKIQGFCNNCAPSPLTHEEKEAKRQKAEEEERRKAEEEAWKALYVVVDLRTGKATGMDVPLDTKLLTNKAFARENLVLRHIPAGEFLMGSPPIEEGRSENEAQHKVHLTRPFHIGIFPVIQGQWQLLMKSNPSGFASVGATAPVENISWDAARGAEGPEEIPTANSFVGVLRTLTGRPFDLPTEAQWEYACRAGNKMPILTDDDVDRVGWFEGNCGGTTHIVGQKTPNAWGLYDMHGNVWELCYDKYGPYEGNVDPMGCKSGACRVVRGGCWGYHAAGCRAASRNRGRPNAQVTCVGFRIVLLHPSPDKLEDEVK